MPQIINGIDSRGDFAELCTRRKVMTAVEVGVECGAFARQFLTKWKGARYWCIDPWEPYWEMDYSRESDYLMTCILMSQFVPIAKVVRARSEDVVETLDPNGVIRFVYIDARHEYEHVAKDMRSWWARLAPTGILAGHDYDQEHEGVRRAVHDFADSLNLAVYVTRDHDTAPSWYIEKP